MADNISKAFDEFLINNNRATVGSSISPLESQNNQIIIQGIDNLQKQTIDILETRKKIELNKNMLDMQNYMTERKSMATLKPELTLDEDFNKETEDTISSFMNGITGLKSLNDAEKQSIQQEITGYKTEFDYNISSIRLDESRRITRNDIYEQTEKTVELINKTTNIDDLKFFVPQQEKLIAVTTEAIKTGALNADSGIALIGNVKDTFNNKAIAFESNDLDVFSEDIAKNMIETARKKDGNVLENIRLAELDYKKTLKNKIDKGDFNNLMMFKNVSKEEIERVVNNSFDSKARPLVISFLNEEIENNANRVSNVVDDDTIYTVDKDKAPSKIYNSILGINDKYEKEIEKSVELGIINPDEAQSLIMKNREEIGKETTQTITKYYARKAFGLGNYITSETNKMLSEGKSGDEIKLFEYNTIRAFEKELIEEDAKFREARKIGGIANFTSDYDLSVGSILSMVDAFVRLPKEAGTGVEQIPISENGIDYLGNLTGNMTPEERKEFEKYYPNIDEVYGLNEGISTKNVLVGLDFDYEGMNTANKLGSYLFSKNGDTNFLKQSNGNSNLFFQGLSAIGQFVKNSDNQYITPDSKGNEIFKLRNDGKIFVTNNKSLVKDKTGKLFSITNFENKENFEIVNGALEDVHRKGSNMQFNFLVHLTNTSTNKNTSEKNRGTAKKLARTIEGGKQLELDEGLDLMNNYYQMLLEEKKKGGAFTNDQLGEFTKTVFSPIIKNSDEATLNFVLNTFDLPKEQQSAIIAQVKNLDLVLKNTNGNQIFTNLKKGLFDKKDSSWKDISGEFIGGTIFGLGKNKDGEALSNVIEAYTTGVLNGTMNRNQTFDKLIEVMIASSITDSYKNNDIFMTSALNLGKKLTGNANAVKMSGTNDKVIWYGVDKNFSENKLKDDLWKTLAYTNHLTNKGTIKGTKYSEAEVKAITAKGNFYTTERVAKGKTKFTIQYNFNGEQKTYTNTLGGVESYTKQWNDFIGLEPKKAIKTGVYTKPKKK